MRTTVVRTGRLTAGQTRARREFWPRFGIDTADTPLDLDAIFNRRAPTILEIGFGMGDTLVAMAAQRPDANFLGAELYPAGIGSTLRKLAAAELTNVRIVEQDAIEVLSQRLSPTSLTGVNIFFPDPWPKKRHHKRRLLQPSLLDLIAARLARGGLLHIATDWVPYADEMLQLLETHPRFRNLAAKGQFSPRPAHRPVTKYERRGASRGHEVRDLLFEKRD